MTIREELRGALTNVLSNASNYPGKVQARLLGQDMGPLTERVTDTALAVFEQAWSHEHTVNVLREDWERLKRLEQTHSEALSNFESSEQAHTPTDDERERIEQSNEIAYTVIEVAQNKAPEEFVTLDFRYGIADALWDAGYRKARRTVQAHTPTDDERMAAHKEAKKRYGRGEQQVRRRVAFEDGAAWAALHRPAQAESTDALIEEALVWIGRAWDDGNAVGLDGWTGPGRGAGEVDREAQHARTRIIHKAEAALRAAFQTGENRE